MNPERHKFEQKQEHLAESTTHQQHEAGQSMEFSKPEEALRYDAAQTSVPENIEERLTRSMKREPRPETAWWKKLLDNDFA